MRSTTLPLVGPLLVGALVAAPAAGCVIETHHDHGAAVAAISAQWQLRNMADGAVTDCPTGFDTAELISQPIDDGGAAVGDPIVDLFDCSQRSGLGAALVPGSYQAWLEIRSHDLMQLYAQSLSQVIDIAETNQPFATDILNDGGYFQLAWDLTGATTRRPVGCADVVGLGPIQAISTSVADPQRVYVDRAACEAHAATTGGLLQGSYTVSIEATAADRSLGTAVTLTSQVISDRNRVTDLGHLAIPIDGM